MVGLLDRCWIVSQGLAALEKPSLGLAGALELDADCKKVVLPQPWRSLPPLPFLCGNGYKPPSDLNDPPGLVIGCGRQSIMPMIALKRRYTDQVRTIQLQDPRVAPEHFDLVICPEHDRLRGANVLNHLGSLTQITPESLVTERARFPELGAGTAKRVAVLIGGANKRFSFDRQTADHVVAQLLDLREQGYRLMVTASRRTGADNEAMMRRALAGDGIFFWDGTGENPYLAYLAWADAILVTVDSVNMVSEAASTHKPVYLLGLPGKPGKFGHFHQDMIQRAHARPFTGEIDRDWQPEPFQETQRIAAEVKRRLF